MGIYIPGMEMPPKGKCLFVAVNGCGDVYLLTSAEEIITKYQPSAKAVELPPHGRLGDLDALFLAMFQCTDGSIIGDKDIDGWPFEARYADIKRFIRQAPTIIPADKEDT